MKLADDVEDLFVKHFAGEDRRKALKYLRPQHRKDSHSQTFFIGQFLTAKPPIEQLKVSQNHRNCIPMVPMTHL